MRRPLRSDGARAVANLAIELGDPGRMAKARRLHRNNGVGAVDIGNLHAEATVVDPSGEMMDVQITIEMPADPDSAPAPESVSASCTCDEDREFCTHALALVLGVAEEVEANGRLLSVWGGAPEPQPVAQQPIPAKDSADAFLRGNWQTPAPIAPLPTLELGTDPVLAVDGIDAAPVLVDARSAIARGLSRYRARR